MVLDLEEMTRVASVILQRKAEDVKYRHSTKLFQRSSSREFHRSGSRDLALKDHRMRIDSL